MSRSFFGMTRQYVLVIHPTRGKIILLSSDLSLKAEEIILAYGYRFKIELAFKVAIYNIGTFLYRFWMRPMDKTRRGDKATEIYKKPEEYQNNYFAKLKAYQVYVQLAFMAQGILQYLSLSAPRKVWPSFGRGIRTIRPNVLPTEMVAGKALGNNLIYFFEGEVLPPKFKKFMEEKVDLQEFDIYKNTG